jgi:sugar phosphate isomerase/epimerase
MEPTDKAQEPTREESQEAPEAEGLKKLNSRIASHDTKIAYLINKIAKMGDKTAVEVEAPEKPRPLESRVTELKRALLDHGLEISGFNETGIIRLKPVNEAGFDTLRKLNTLFSVETLEAYFEQYLD